jgi:hypothetical protein
MKNLILGTHFIICFFYPRKPIVSGVQFLVYRSANTPPRAPTPIYSVEYSSLQFESGFLPYRSNQWLIHHNSVDKNQISSSSRLTSQCIGAIMVAPANPHRRFRRGRAAERALACRSPSHRESAKNHHLLIDKTSTIPNIHRSSPWGECITCLCRVPHSCIVFPL